MISGHVNANREAIIPLIVLDAEGREHGIEAIIDTGFTGFLVLPASLIDTLHLRWRARAAAMLGDGSTHVFDVYAATVVWDGSPRLIEVDAANTEPLVGMSLLDGYDLRIQVRPDGAVTVQSGC